MRDKRKQEQFMVLVDPDVMRRMDTLRVVMGVSRGEVMRIVLAGKTLDTLERQQNIGIVTLRGVAASLGLGPDEFVSALVKDRKRVPTLEALRAMTPAALRTLLANESVTV
jgi:hypothetical protein